MDTGGDDILNASRPVAGHAVGIVSAIAVLCLLFILLVTVVAKRRLGNHEENSSDGPSDEEPVLVVSHSHSGNTTDGSEIVPPDYAPWLRTKPRTPAAALERDLVAPRPPMRELTILHDNLSVSTGIQS